MKLNFKNLIPLIPILFLLFYNKLIVNFYIKLFIILITNLMISRKNIAEYYRRNNFALRNYFFINLFFGLIFILKITYY